MPAIANFRLGHGLATAAWAVSMLLALPAPSARTEAQSPVSLRYFYSDPPSAAESLADEYGQALVAELARLMWERADAACIKPRNLSESALKPIAGEILRRYGDKLSLLRYPPIDDVAVEAEFTKRVGAKGVSEMRKFAGDPNIHRLFALAAPRDRDDVVDEITQSFDLYLEAREKLSIGAGLSTSNTGNPALLSLREKRETPHFEATEALKDEAWFEHFVELRLSLEEAIRVVLEASGQGNLDYLSAFKGVETDLRNACVRLDKRN